LNFDTMVYIQIRSGRGGGVFIFGSFRLFIFS